MSVSKANRHGADCGLALARVPARCDQVLPGGAKCQPPAAAQMTLASRSGRFSAMRAGNSGCSTAPPVPAIKATLPSLFELRHWLSTEG